MSALNIVIMGKTGVGKSTLINAILDDEVAETGIGQAVTKDGKWYYKDISNLNWHFIEECYDTINMYDTVGLELNKAVTRSTLDEVKSLLDKSTEKDGDITAVWFCVNYGNNRFEQFEIELVRELSLNYEIPFIIVITQCYSDEECELEKQIKNALPEVVTHRIMSRARKLRDGTVLSPFGLSELLSKTISDYDKLRIKVLENKLDSLSEKRQKRIEKMKQLGNECNVKYADKAMKIGFLPGGCIPFVYGICIKMLVEIDKIFGIKTAKGFEEEIFANIIVGIIATPLMTIPLVSAGVAYAYVGSVGETYINSIVAVIHRSSDRELNDNALMAERIREELQRRKK